jgi:hypothetical protein
MPALTRADKINHISKQQRRLAIKYSNGHHRPYEGQALYLPKNIYSGDGILDRIGSFLMNNKDNISAIGNTIGTVTDTIGKVATIGIDIYKQIRTAKKAELIMQQLKR